MTLEIADDFLNELKIPESLRVEALKKAKEGYVMALVEAGEISSGRAGTLLGVSRLEILEMMGKWGISVFDDEKDLEGLSQEVEQAQLLLARQPIKYRTQTFRHLMETVESVPSDFDPQQAKEDYFKEKYNL